MSDTDTGITLPTNWKDFGERVLRAALTGAVAAASTIHFVVDGWSIANIETAAKAIAVGALTAAFTAAKALVFQGRGSNPADGSAK